MGSFNISLKPDIFAYQSEIRIFTIEKLIEMDELISSY